MRCSTLSLYHGIAIVIRFVNNNLLSFSILIQSRLTHFLSVWDTIVSEYASKYVIDSNVRTNSINLIHTNIHHNLSLISLQHAAIIVICYHGKKITPNIDVSKRDGKSIVNDKADRYLFSIIDAIDVVMEEYSITKLKIISNVNKDCLALASNLRMCIYSDLSSFIPFRFIVFNL